MSKSRESCMAATDNDAQIIILKSDDKQCCHNVHDTNVNIFVNAGNHDHGSSKVKLKNFVDYKWEVKHYPGHLIAVHRSGKFIAYAINVNNKATRMEGMVRVVHSSTGLRALIKGMFGEVLDLQFANIEKESLLAIIDVNSLNVHKIDLLESTLMCNLLLKIEDPKTNYIPKYDKLAWCPYVASDDSSEDDDESHLILWAQGTVVQCFNIKTIVTAFGTGKFMLSTITSGVLTFEEDTLITWVALSPDGTTLAAACGDGVIRFYQVYMFDDQNHRCLHKWTPHEGKIITSLFFLDNLHKSISDKYWKYAITAADNNSEYKIWDCTSWKCMQTIKIFARFKPEKPLHFNAEIDRSGSYLVVSSLETRAVYIMQIVNYAQRTQAVSDNSINSLRQLPGGKQIEIGTTDMNGSSGVASSSTENRNNSNHSKDNFVGIRSIAEFPLNSEILSFSIVNAVVRRMKYNNDNYLGEDPDDYDEESNRTITVAVHMFVVQSKSMQECYILYQPTVNDYAGSGQLSSSTGSSDPSDALINDTSRKETFSPLSDTKPNSLELIFGTAQNTIREPPTAKTATSSAVIAVAAAAAAAPSAVSQPDPTTLSHIKSSSVSPQSGVNKGFTQLNLLTPDAFNATTGGAIPSTSVAAAASTSAAVSANDKKTPETVSSDVLNTLFMLAGVNPKSTTNLNNMIVNNKVIENREAQKYKQTLDVHKKFIAIDRNPERNAAGDQHTAGSGSSSPSREVEEIMSIQGHDKFNDEGLNDLGDELLLTGTLDKDNKAKDNVDKVVSAATVSNWPTAPIVIQLPSQVAKTSAELQNAADIMSQAVSGATQNNNLPPTLGAAAGGSAGLGNKSLSNNSLTASHSNADDSGTSMDPSDINVKLNQLIDLVKMQSKQIGQLQNEIGEMKKVSSNPISTNQNLSEFSFKLELQLSKLMDQYLKRFDSEYKKKIAHLIQGRERQNCEIRDCIIHILNQYTINQFTDTIAKVVNLELQRNIMPMLAAKMDNIQKQIQMDATQKFRSFDLMLEENIAQVCQSKNFVDNFGKTVLAGVQSSLQTAFIESMSNTLIPAYEKSSQNMFKQLHDAFTIGIKDFLVQFDTYLQHLKPNIDAHDQLLNKFNIFRQYCEASMSKNNTVVQTAMIETNKEIKSMEILLARQIQETIRNELRKGFDTQNNLRSQAATPAPGYDLKETIKAFIQQGHINKAFHQALLANDLGLVEFTLRNVDHTNVFTPTCVLEQKVLLSLMQQISADMSNHDETKQNYLSEALLAINVNDPITREHAPKVLQELYVNCQLFLKNYPKSSQCSNVRMLMKAVLTFNGQF